MNQINIQAQQKAQGKSADVIDLLAQQLTLDPELAAVLGQGGEGAEVAFDELLSSTLEANPDALQAKNISEKEVQGLAKLIMNKGQEQSQEAPLTKGMPLSNEMSTEEFTTLQSENKNVLLNAKSQVKVSNPAPLEQLNNQSKLTANAANTSLPEIKEVKEGNLLTRASEFLKSKAPKIANNKEADVIDFNTKLNQKVAVKNAPVQMNASIKNAYRMNKGKSLLNNAEVNTSAVQVEAPKVKTQSLQEMMFNSNQSESDMAQNFSEQMASPKDGMKAANNIQSAGKAFNINELAGSTTQDGVISKIQDYIVQSKVENQSNVELSFHHKDLGQVDLKVQKMSGEALNIQIATNTADGAKFFTQNQTDLLQSLGKAGIQVGEFKLETSQSSSSNGSSLAQDNSSSSSEGGQKGQNQPGNQKDQDSKRREELWNLFQERSKAAA